MPTAFRLLTGEYIVVDEVGPLPDDPDKLIVTHPFQVSVAAAPNGMKQLKFEPWLAPRMTLYPNAVCARINDPDLPEHIRDGYLQASTGVAVARQMPAGRA